MSRPGNEIELECKIPVSGREALASRLRELGATDHGEAHERNWVFDLPGGDLRRERKLLRVRDDGKATITYKGPPLASEFKSREEIECQASSSDALRKILLRTGFEEKWFYEKLRRSFSYLGCEVALDLLPELGEFVEVEGGDADAIKAVLNALGLAYSAHVPESYLGLFVNKLKAEGREFCDLRFSGCGVS